MFFNGMYPFIDASTGGNIKGMIASADRGLRMAGPRAKIVPGHGALGDREALRKYRDMLVAERDRVQKLKAAGRTAKEAAARFVFSVFTRAFTPRSRIFMSSDPAARL